MSEVVTKNDLAKILSRIPLLKLPLTNLVDGGKTGSVRGTYTENESSFKTGSYAFAEGYNTRASGDYSHAEGVSSKAVGAYSHAQNYNTIADYSAQTVLGKYNNNQSDTALEIGNGTSDSARSNALTVDWSGNIDFGGIATGNNGTRDIELNITEATITKYVALGMSLI